MYNSKIIGMGKYIPEKTVTNFDLAEMIDTSDEWIRERTGISERHYAVKADETTSMMGTRAAQAALKMAGMQASEIDFIVFATLSPDYDFPGSGCFTQHQLGLDSTGALDIRNQCCGFVYGMAVADQFIKTGMYKNILVIGAEAQSHGIDMSTRGRNVAVIFGDGAGAAILTATDDNKKGILANKLHADGKYADELCLKIPGSNNNPRLSRELMDSAEIYPYMNGKYVFKHAVTMFPKVINEVLAEAGHSISDLDLVIPHQANKRITEAVQMRLGVGPEKVYSNIHKYGNTTAASVPIALTEAIEEGRVKDGDLICLAGFGSGFTWASNLIRW